MSLKIGGVLLDQLRQLVQQPAPIARAQLRPFAFKRASRCRNSFVDVRLVGFRNLGERLASRGVWSRESLPGFSIHPLSVNKKFVGFHKLKLRRTCKQLSQQERKDAAVLEVVHFDGRVDS